MSFSGSCGCATIRTRVWVTTTRAGMWVTLTTVWVVNVTHMAHRSWSWVQLYMPDEYNCTQDIRMVMTYQGTRKPARVGAVRRNNRPRAPTRLNLRGRCDVVPVHDEEGVR